MVLDPRVIVIDAVDRLERSLGEGDLDGAVACFVPDGAVFGSGPAELAHGELELRRLLGDLSTRDVDLHWKLVRVFAYATDREVWFVAGARLDALEDGKEQRHWFRMSGILRRSSGQYRFELFNGFEPLPGVDARSVSL